MLCVFSTRNLNTVEDQVAWYWWLIVIETKLLIIIIIIIFFSVSGCFEFIWSLIFLAWNFDTSGLEKMSRRLFPCHVFFSHHLYRLRFIAKPDEKAKQQFLQHSWNPCSFFNFLVVTSWGWQHPFTLHPSPLRRHVLGRYGAVLAESLCGAVHCSWNVGIVDDREGLLLI